MKRRVSIECALVNARRGFNVFPARVFIVFQARRVAPRNFVPTAPVPKTLGKIGSNKKANASAPIPILNARSGALVGSLAMRLSCLRVDRTTMTMVHSSARFPTSSVLIPKPPYSLGKRKKKQVTASADACEVCSSRVKGGVDLLEISGDDSGFDTRNENNAFPACRFAPRNFVPAIRTTRKPTPSRCRAHADAWLGSAPLQVNAERH